MARLYADENFPFPVVEELRRLGHDVLTIFEDGRANQRYPDVLILQGAAVYGRAVLTLNRRHFRILHEEGMTHAGLILCTYDPDFSGQARRIHEAPEAHEFLTGKLIRVNRSA